MKIYFVANLLFDEGKAGINLDDILWVNTMTQESKGTRGEKEEITVPPHGCLTIRNEKSFCDEETILIKLEDAERLLELMITLSHIELTNNQVPKKNFFQKAIAYLTGAK